jgi:predicted  nucleic acid-binding Zn-ribbon protein
MVDEVTLFEFETKIRKLILDMVDPFTKRQATDREFMAKLRTDLEAARRKIEEQEYAMSKVDTKLTTFDEVFKKIAAVVTFYNLISIE